VQDVRRARPQHPHLSPSHHEGSLMRALASVLTPSSQAVVHRYFELNAWLDIRDLEHEAAVVAIEERATWRPDGGSDLNRWIACKVAEALSRFVAEQRSPVHVPDCKGKEGSPERRRWLEASGSQREELVAIRPTRGVADGHRENPAVAAVAVEQWVPLEERLDAASAAAEVRRILDQQCEAARLVLLEQQKPAAVAARLGMSARQVYDRTAAAMRALREAFLAA
jgi:hypothetical protein